MKAFTNQSLFALVAVALLSSCSRPYATFQKTTPEHFYTKVTEKAVETPVLEAEAITVEQPATSMAAEVIAPVTPTTVEAELKKVDAVVSTKSGLATNKKLSRHLAKVKEMVTELRAKVTNPAATFGATQSSVAPQKMNLMQRLVAKSIDKKIQHKLAPKDTKKAMARGLLSLGLIIALIGLLLILIGTGTVYSLGYVGLIVGIVLIIASLI